ncbi:hypothetical protein LZ554_007566 [Drepanopeziza brunnea f. sp. 'monogermtubi']|nr:hypothetical protein LZ554_007566 [Drepanopeziza brunnea f. sp. 'monogermtubi']
MTSGLRNTPARIAMSAAPLTDSKESSLNSAPTSPTKTSTLHHYEVTMHSADSESPPSPLFVTNVSSDSFDDRENFSPSKVSQLSAKSPIERDHTSPLKMLKIRTSPTSAAHSPRRDISPTRSIRKLSSPDKRFPVKPSLPVTAAASPARSASPEKRPVVTERTVNMEDILRDNEGLTKAIEILEDEDSDSNEDQPSENTSTSYEAEKQGHSEEPSMDDTMVSTFSEFSAVPDMTMFAKIGHSPTKFASLGPTPRRTQMNTPATLRRPAHDNSPSPTPRRHRYGTSKDEGNTTNLILDFTEQFHGFSGRAQGQSPTRQGRQSPLKESATVAGAPWATTPSMKRNTMSNLLDFDIPPAPTPRSMPSITPRELESLKSNFLSEISSLKASLSGKEAEVQSLKTAVGDAEKRVGETMEQVREERDLKEQLAAEKEEWDKRGREMEAVLRNVKEEIVHGERERDELEGRLNESETRREAAEIMAQEAESKMAAMKAGKSSPGLSPEPHDNKPGECGCGGRAVEIAVEKVSRELHTLYKEKHETKVSALKKSYERRWDKKITELEHQVEDLTRENEDLRRDLTMTKVDPRSALEVTEEREKAAARDAKSKELEAELEGLSHEIRSVKHDNSDLRKLLDEERVEKGKLVQAVDEMIPLVAAFDDMLAKMDSVPANLPAAAPPTPHTQAQHSKAEDLRGSLSRASGLRAPTGIAKPGGGESRIGRGGFGAPSSAASSRERSGSALAMSRPGSGLGYRSGIMSNIEKMGSYKGRGE